MIGGGACVASGEDPNTINDRFVPVACFGGGTSSGSDFQKIEPSKEALEVVRKTKWGDKKAEMA